LAVVATLLSGSVAEAATFSVTNTDPSGNGSLAEAITNANNAGGSNGIVFESGLSGSIDLTSSLPTITSPLTITGPGARELTVDGDGHEIFYFQGTDTQSDSVSGLTLTGGDPGAVGSNSPALNLTGDTLSGNTNAYGGAVFAIGHLTIDDSTISGNTAQGSGGIDAHAGLSLTSSTVSGNTATEFASGGIGLYYDNTVPANPLTVTDSTIVDNSATAADSQGGGVNIDGGSVPSATFQNSIVAGNAAAIGPDINSPAGMSQVVPTASFSLIQNPSGSDITPTSTDRFGDDPQLGPLQDNGGQTDTMMPRLDSPVIDAGSKFGQTTDQRGLSRPVDLPGVTNAAGGDGSDIGAVEVQTSEAAPATETVTNTNDSGTGSLRAAIDAVNGHPGANTITFQSGLSGSIDLASSLPNIYQPVWIDGPGARVMTVDGEGHTMFQFFNGYVSSRFDEISGLTLTGGSTPGPGGAVDAGGYPTLMLEADTLSHDTAGGYGGGVFALGALTIGNSTIDDDSATHGGGIAAINGLSLSNSTVTGNTATVEGGGVYAGTQAVLIDSSTISGNQASGATAEGGGLRLNDGETSATLDNTIVAGNTAANGPDVFTQTGGVVPTAAFSLIGSLSASGITPASTDITGKAPELGALANNGGSTDTMLPADNSPVIDQGNSFGSGADQRLFTRPVDLPGYPNASGGDGSDIGSVELQPVEVLPVITGLSAGSGSAGTSVVITGTHLASATKVLFGSAAATFTVNSDTQIIATAPAGSGSVDVRVVSPGGESAAVAADMFSYDQMMMAKFDGQELTLTTPSASSCTAPSTGLPVKFSSAAITKSAVKFSSAAFYIDKGIKHSRKAFKRLKHGKRKKVTVVTYVPNVVVRHASSTLSIKLAGEKAGTHTLKLIASYREKVTKHHHKVTITVTKALKVTFKVC
jgi:IPT/TIG domain/Right handed beta helix region